MSELLTNSVDWVWACLSLAADVMVKATLLLVAACAVHLSLRRRRLALSQSALYHGLLAVLVLLPLVTAAFPPLRIPILPPPEVYQPVQVPPAWMEAANFAKPAAIEAQPAPGEKLRPLAGWDPHSVDRDSLAGGESLVATEPTSEPASAAAAGEPGAKFNWAALLLGLYVAGFAVLTVRLIAALRAVARLRRNSRPSDEPAWPTAVQQWSRRLGITRPVQVAVSDACNVPVAFGAFRPVIVIPSSLAEGLDAEHCNSIVLHELAHVRRRDYAWQILLRIVQAAYWPNPLIWVFGRLLAAAREQACDDLCAYHESRPEAYRTALLQVARTLVHRPAFSLGIAMARSSRLGERLVRIDRGYRAASCLASWPVRAAVAVTALTIATVVGSAQLAERTAQAKKESASANPGPAVAQIADDIRIQLVSVRRNQGEDRSVWAPDGAPLSEAPYRDAHTALNHPDPYEFAFRFTGKTDIDMKAIPQAGKYSAELDIPRDASRSPIGDMRVLVRGGFEDEESATEISLMVATGEWEAVERYQIPWGEGDSVIISRESIVLDLPRKEGGRYFVDTTHTYTDQATHVLFVGEDGTEYEADRRPRGKGSGIVQERWFLPKSLTLDQLKAIVFLKRPYTHTITFHNVSLQPGQQTDVQVVIAKRDSPSGPSRSGARAPTRVRENQDATRPGAADGFGPVIECVVNDDGMRKDLLIDFETSRLLTPPESTHGQHDALFKWIADNGVDAMGETKASVQGLMGFDMIAVPIDSQQWDGDPAFIRGELKLGRPGTPAVMSAKGELPATFLFQTREGGMGVLQITGFSDQPRGVRVRYKMLREDTPSTQPVPVPAATGSDGSRSKELGAWNLFRLTDVGEMLSPLVARMAPVVQPEARSQPMWKGEPQNTRIVLNLQAEQHQGEEIVIGFFDDPIWSSPPRHARAFPGPGRYTLTDVPPGEYQLGLVMGMDTGPLPVAGWYTEQGRTRDPAPKYKGLGIHATWPRPVGVAANQETYVRAMVSPEIKRSGVQSIFDSELVAWIGNWKEDTDPDRLVTVRTVDHQGRPEPCCKITFTERKGDRTLGWIGSGTDTKGLAYCDALTREFTVTAMRFSFDPRTLADINEIRRYSQVYDPFEKPDITVKWDRWPTGPGKVTGHVRNQHGQPLTEYYMTIVRQEGDRLADGDYYAWRYHIPVVDPEGRYEVTNLAAGTYAVGIRAFDYPTYVWFSGVESEAPTFTIAADSGAEAKLDIEVEARQLLYGKAVYPDGSPVYPATHTVYLTRDERRRQGASPDYIGARMKEDGVFRVALSQEEREKVLEHGDGLVEIRALLDNHRLIDLGELHIDGLSKDPDTPAVFKFPRPEEVQRANGPPGPQTAADSEEEREELAAENARPEAPTVIVAEHLLLFEGKVVTWEEVEPLLAKRPGRERISFVFTNGVYRSGHSDEFNTKAKGLAKRLGFKTTSWSSTSPRASGRYDAIRSQEDVPQDVNPYDIRLIVARNVVLHRNRNVSWAQVEALIRASHDKAGFHLTVSETRGARESGSDKQFRDKLYGLMDQLKFAVTHEGMDTSQAQRCDALGPGENLISPDGPQLVGRVLTPQGEPAADAQVVVLRGETMASIYLRGARLRDPLDEVFVETDERGQYSIGRPDRPFMIVVLHPAGFVEVSQDELADGGEIRLKPWARIDGVVKVGTDPAPGQRVSFGRPGEQMPGGLRADFSTEAKSDEAGRFSFTHVPPGRVNASLMMEDPRTQSSRSSHHQIVEVKAGETLHVQMAGTGRPVTGRIVIPQGSDLRTQDVVASGWLWPKQTTARGALAVVVRADGTFRVNDVPSGEYVLNLDVQAFDGNRAGDTLGGVSAAVSVPATPESRIDEPFDLGGFEIELKERKTDADQP